MNSRCDEFARLGIIIGWLLGFAVAALAAGSRTTHWTDAIESARSRIGLIHGLRTKPAGASSSLMRWLFVLLLLISGQGSVWAEDEDRAGAGPTDAPQQMDKSYDKQAEPEIDGVSPTVAKECPDKLAPADAVRKDDDLSRKPAERIQSKECS